MCKPRAGIAWQGHRHGHGYADIRTDIYTDIRTYGQQYGHGHGIVRVTGIDLQTSPLLSH